MNIQAWFCVCFFFKLYLIASNATPSPKTFILDKKPTGIPEKDDLLRKIDDLINRYKKGEDVDSQVEGPFVEGEKLPDEVTITQGHTTLLEYAKSWLIPGYQPVAYGTAASPLIQHTFKRVNTPDGSVPTYGVATIAPTNAPHVTESSRYLNPYHVAQLKKSAGKIVQDIQNSPEKFRFA